MEQAKLIEKLESLGKDIDSKIEKANLQAKNASEEAIKKSEAVASELKDELNKKMNEYVDGVKKIESITAKQQEQMDSLSVKLDRPEVSHTGNKDLKTILIDTLKKDFKDFKGFNMDRRKFSLDLKGVDIFNTKAGNMTTANTITGTFPYPTNVPGIYYDPDTTFSMRNIMTVSQTNSNSIQYQQESALDNGIANTAEGSALTASDSDVATVTENVRTIGTYFKVTEELANDLDVFMNYITQRLTRKMVVHENSQILFGAGTGQNLTGITVDATAYADQLNEGSNATYYDVLLSAIQQCQVSEYQPNAVLVHPLFYMYLQNSKNSQGSYHIPDAVFSPYRMTISGVPVYATTAMATSTGVKDGFLVGDFKYGTTLWDRMSPVVEIANTDQDDFIKKNITVRVWERIALTNYRPNAFRYGNFVAAKNLATY